MADVKVVTSIAGPRSPYWATTLSGRPGPKAAKCAALEAQPSSEIRFVEYRHRRDRQHRFRRSRRVAFSRCGVDGTGPVAEYAGGLPRRSHGACPLARRAQRADHAHLARGPAGFHRLARARRRAAALDRTPALELPPLLPLLHARGCHPRGSYRADRHAEDRPLAAALAHRGGGRVAAVGARGE